MTKSSKTTASFDKKFSETTLGYLSDIGSAIRTTRAVSGPLAKSLYDDGFVVTDLYPHSGPNAHKSTSTKVWFDEYLFPTIASFAGFEAALWTAEDIKDGKHGDDVVHAKRDKQDAKTMSIAFYQKLVQLCCLWKKAVEPILPDLQKFV